MRFPPPLTLIFGLVASFLSLMRPISGYAQSLAPYRTDGTAHPVESPEHYLAESAVTAESVSRSASSSEALLPSAPEPASEPGGDERAHVPWAGTEQLEPFSRLGIGGSVSPLGIGISSTILLTQYFDGRLTGNFFGYSPGIFEVSGFRVDAHLHWASLGTALDWYPRKSVFRLSAGMLLYNGDEFSASSVIAPGTSFTVDGQTFYSASPNAATGATPVTGSGVLGLHTHQPAFTLSGGFGKFVPRSNRHWSFPFEIGAVFMGSPTVDVTTAGWVCRDAKQTQCSNLADPTNPVTIEFNKALQAQITKWRNDVEPATVYPIFSYSVVYSFNIR